jgi:putative heme iron utilization protein
MDKTVREHIQNLQQKRNLLSAHVMDEADAKQRNQLESELRAVEAALKFYQDALETERRLSQWRPA